MVRSLCMVWTSELDEEFEFFAALSMIPPVRLERYGS